MYVALRSGFLSSPLHPSYLIVFYFLETALFFFYDLRPMSIRQMHPSTICTPANLKVKVEDQGEDGRLQVDIPNASSRSASPSGSLYSTSRYQPTTSWALTGVYNLLDSRPESTIRRTFGPQYKQLSASMGVDRKYPACLSPAISSWTRPLLCRKALGHCWKGCRS